MIASAADLERARTLIAKALDALARIDAAFAVHSDECTCGLRAGQVRMRAVRADVERSLIALVHEVSVYISKEET